MALGGLAAVLLVAMTAVATEAQSRTPGVTDAEIVIGVTAPMSGPAAIYGNLALAKEAWARYVNDQGGVHGRRLKVVLKDDGFNPARAVANLSEMKDSVFLVAGLVGSAVTSAAKGEIAEARLPLVNAYASPRLWAREPRDKLRYVFIDYPDYTDEADYLVTYSVTRLGAQNLAVFYQNDDWGRGVMDGVHRALKTLGPKATLAIGLGYEVSDRDLSVQALKFKEAGADTLFLAALNAPSAILVREMAKVGYRPRLVGSFTIGDHLVMYRHPRRFVGGRLLHRHRCGAGGSGSEGRARHPDQVRAEARGARGHRAHRGHQHDPGCGRAQKGWPQPESRRVHRGHGGHQELHRPRSLGAHHLRAASPPWAQCGSPHAGPEGRGPLVHPGRPLSVLQGALLSLLGKEFKEPR
jgi:hypothetical protein